MEKNAEVTWVTSNVMMKKIELRCGQTTGNCEYSGKRRGN